MMSAVRMCSQVCDALVYIHGLQLVHGYVCEHAVYMISRDFIKLGSFQFMSDGSVAFFRLSTAYGSCDCLVLMPGFRIVG